MVFSSLFFVFFFLTLNLLIYNLVDGIEKKNIVMLVFSLIFYSWAGPKYLILLLGMVFISWFTAIMIEGSRKKSVKRKYLTLACVLLIGLLGIFKYLNFFTGITSSLIGLPSEATKIVLPVGISFYTFQLLSYVVDVYRGKVAAQRKYWHLLLYAALFHQCIAGPIVRYQLVADEIDHRKVRVDEFSKGIMRFMVGLAKKAILANSCASVADALFPSGHKAIVAIPAGGLWIGLLFYMLQIYLDFSAYSDMAIGMGWMIGFHYNENFNYPYIATSIKDFWNRWHISLSTFFRDYVYIPLGGNRKGAKRRTINLLVVWALTGFWHGASWNYILWGLYFFVFICIENKGWLDKLKKLPGGVRHLYAMLVVYFGWALFRQESIADLGTSLKGMFGLNGNGFMDMATSIQIKNNIFLLIFCIIASTPLIKYIGRFFRGLVNRVCRIPYPVYVYEMIAPIALLILSFMALIGNSYNPFLYFQF